MNHEEEGLSLRPWLEQHGVLDDPQLRIISFSLAILPYVDEDLGVRNWRDELSQRQELQLFAEGYELLAEITACLRKAKLRYGSSFLAGIHHIWARDLFRFAALRDMVEALLVEDPHSLLVLIVDIPFHLPDIAEMLPAGWTCEFLGSSGAEFEYGEVFRRCKEVRRGAKTRFKLEQKQLGPISPFNLRWWARRAAGTPVLVVVQDSGTGINLTSAVAVVEKLRERGCRPVSLAGLPPGHDGLSLLGPDAYVVPTGFKPRWYADLTRGLEEYWRAIGKFCHARGGIVWALFAATSRPALSTHLRMAATMQRAITALHKHFGFDVAVMVNESTFLSAAATECLKARSVETVGVTTVLYMDHPMCSYWPSRHHLVYGEQMVELMVKKGEEKETITVVGSEHFDMAFRRDRAEDEAYLRSLFPAWGKRKLVVVATEARARQMIEIDPSLRILAEMSDVYTVLKLHPSDEREDFEHLVAELGHPENVVIAEKMDVQALMHVCDLLVTMGSNLIIEAGVVGTPTLVFNFEGTPCPIDFVAEGLCEGAYSPAEFEAKVLRFLGDAEFRARALGRLSRISRFNGPNDGKSAHRIARFAHDLTMERLGERTLTRWLRPFLNGRLRRKACV